MLGFTQLAGEFLSLMSSQKLIFFMMILPLFHRRNFLRLHTPPLQVWQWMKYGPFDSAEEISAFYKQYSNKANTQSYLIRHWGVVRGVLLLLKSRPDTITFLPSSSGPRNSILPQRRLFEQGH